MADEYNVVDPKKSSKKIILLILILLLACGITFAAYFYTKVSKPASSESAPVNFTVARGSSTDQIAEKLYQDKIISSKLVFTAYAKLTGAANKIQAGDYALNRNMTITEIIDVLTKGRVVSSERNITVVEGLSNKQLAAYLESRNIFSAADFNSALNGSYDFRFASDAAKAGYEGFLFPDTYKISKNADASALVQRMLSNFESKITEQMISDMQAQGFDILETITLASIIEREVGRNKETITAEDRTLMQRERELVSSVFHNRLKIGMALESDATVNYVTGKSDRRALLSDTRIQSPYNTYVTRGLPPGPISNPGIDAIRAAIYPAQSDYFYFLNDPDGVAYFGRTLAEHNANRARYLE